MLKALKNLGKRTLSLILLIIFIPIIIIILLFSLQSCNRKISYEKYEEKMIVAAKKYFKTNNLVPEYGGESSMVLLSTLVDNNYIKSPSKLLSDDSCTGSVTVRRNGLNEYGENNLSLNYLPNLVCKNYNSKTLLSNLMKDLTTSESGLYEMNDGYVFKGDMVNNYLMFYGNLYRIMSIDSSGVVKLIKEEAEPITRVWDNKYNVEADRSYGISIYKDSSIKKGLMDDYNNKKKINDQARVHVLPHDVCIGKRAISDLRIGTAIDCSEVLTNQVISLPSVSDFALASLDSNCDSIVSKSCKNYNYLYSVLNDSWTLSAITDNTYQIYYISTGLAYLDIASEHHTYNIVIYIDGNENIKSGNGSKTLPYVIE